MISFDLSQTDKHDDASFSTNQDKQMPIAPGGALANSGGEKGWGCDREWAAKVMAP
ncbi:MAG TPA: hypothetical protein VIM63_05305 [Rhodoferax sp.]